MKKQISGLILSTLIFSAPISKATEDDAGSSMPHGRVFQLTKEMLGHDISREPETDFQTNMAHMRHQATDYLWLETLIADFPQTTWEARKKPIHGESSMIEKIDILRQEIKTLIRQRFDSVNRVIKHTQEVMYYFDQRLMEQEKQANLSRTMLRRRLIAIDDCITDLRDSNKTIQESIRNLFSETAQMRANFFELSHRMRVLEAKMEAKR